MEPNEILKSLEDARLFIPNPDNNIDSVYVKSDDLLDELRDYLRSLQAKIDGMIKRPTVDEAIEALETAIGVMYIDEQVRTGDRANAKAKKNRRLGALDNLARELSALPKGVE